MIFSIFKNIMQFSYLDKFFNSDTLVYVGSASVIALFFVATAIEFFNSEDRSESPSSEANTTSVERTPDSAKESAISETNAAGDNFRSEPFRNLTPEPAASIKLEQIPLRPLSSSTSEGTSLREQHVSAEPQPAPSRKGKELATDEDLERWAREDLLIKKAEKEYAKGSSEENSDDENPYHYLTNTPYNSEERELDNTGIIDDERSKPHEYVRQITLDDYEKGDDENENFVEEETTSSSSSESVSPDSTLYSIFSFIYDFICQIVSLIFG
jgi:hypothetical protein